jgi:hypothetical protein
VERLWWRLWEILDHNRNCNCQRVSGALLIPDLGSNLDLRHSLDKQREIRIPDMATTLSQSCCNVVPHHLEALNLLPFEEDLIRGRPGRHPYDPRGR